jgi:hypothetical protein
MDASLCRGDDGEGANLDTARDLGILWWDVLFVLRHKSLQSAVQCVLGALCWITRGLPAARLGRRKDTGRAGAYWLSAVRSRHLLDVGFPRRRRTAALRARHAEELFEKERLHDLIRLIGHRLQRRLTPRARRYDVSVLNAAA